MLAMELELKKAKKRGAARKRSREDLWWKSDESEALSKLLCSPDARQIGQRSAVLSLITEIQSSAIQYSVARFINDTKVQAIGLNSWRVIRMNVWEALRSNA